MTLLTAKETQLPKSEIIEKLMTYSKLWSQLALSDFMEKKLQTSKLN